MTVAELPCSFDSGYSHGASMSWWDADAECTLVMSRPSDDEALWREYLVGAERSYRKHGVSVSVWVREQTPGSG